MGFLEDFDHNAPLVFLDQRDAGQFSDPFDVLLWDQRTGAVHLFVESMWAFAETDDGEPDWSRSSREVVLTHENRLLVHAANVDDDTPIPTVPERLEQLALVIVRKDGEVFRRHEVKQA